MHGAKNIKLQACVCVCVFVWYVGVVCGVCVCGVCVGVGVCSVCGV